MAQDTLAFELLGCANDCLTMYYSAPPTEGLDRPRYSLLCNAVEFALKAYIALHRGFTQNEQLEGIGNDLENLLAEATSLGLPIDPLTRREIEKLNEVHDAASVFVIKPF
jgi:hypothetical protein